MMKRLILLITILLVSIATQATAVEHRLGLAGNYWVTLDDIDLDNNEVDEFGFSFGPTYQYWFDLFGLQVDLEFLPDRFDNNSIAPQVYFLAGRGIYVGIGTGIIYSQGEFEDSPFYALRGGVNLEVLPGMYADIYANFRFNDTADIDNEESDIDTDTIFLGVAFRFVL